MGWIGSIIVVSGNRGRVFLLWKRALGCFVLLRALFLIVVSGDVTGRRVAFAKRRLATCTAIVFR